MPGKPFQSVLIQYEDEINIPRRRRPPYSYARIAKFLQEKYRLNVCRETIFKFVKAQARGRKVYAIYGAPLPQKPKSIPAASLPPEILNSIAEQLERTVGFARSAGRIVRDTPANEMWETIYYLLSEGRPGLAGGLLNRAEAQVLRLSLIYALMDCSSVIRVEHLQAATAVWDYCEASVRYIFGTKTGDQYADRITEALLESENGYLTDDDIGRLFGGHRTREKDLALEQALKTKEANQAKEPKTA
jgi:hypothetical protein